VGKQTQIANPQILGPNSANANPQIFGACQSANPQIFMINPQIANPQIASPHISTKCCTTLYQIKIVLKVFLKSLFFIYKFESEHYMPHL
jgi:hypothetical protein